MKSRFAVFSVIFALFSVFFVACSNADPKDVAISFYKAVANGDEKGAVKLIYIEDESKRDEYEGKIALTAGLVKNEVIKKGGIKDIEVTEEKIEGDKAEITLKVSYNKSDKTETRKVKLVRVNGTWMIGDSK